MRSVNHMKSSDAIIERRSRDSLFGTLEERSFKLLVTVKGLAHQFRGGKYARSKHSAVRDYVLAAML
jgi:hypothetical protein